MYEASVEQRVGLRNVAVCLSDVISHSQLNSPYLILLQNYIIMSIWKEKERGEEEVEDFLSRCSDASLGVA